MGVVALVLWEVDRSVGARFGALIRLVLLDLIWGRSMGHRES